MVIAVKKHFGLKAIDMKSDDECLLSEEIFEIFDKDAGMAKW